MYSSLDCVRLKMKISGLLLVVHSLCQNLLEVSITGQCRAYKHVYCSILFFLSPVTISRRLFDAIRQVETEGECDPLNAVGDRGRSRGPYQIGRIYYIDAVQYNPRLQDGGKSYENVYGSGSMEYSERVMQAYMDRYATEARLGHPATDEDIARIHNGGPYGFRKSSTLKYWEKVQAYL